MGQTQEPPGLEKNFERLIAYGDEWLQSLGSWNWNVAYEIEHYYSKTHSLQRKWNFSSRLVSFSVVYLWASLPRGAFFLGLTSHRERNQGSELQRGIWFRAPPGFPGCQHLPELREAAWAVPAPGLRLWPRREAGLPMGLRKHRPASIRCLSDEPETSPNQTSWKGARVDSLTFFGTLSPTPPTQGKFSIS